MAALSITVAVVLYNGMDHVSHCLEGIANLEGDVAEVVVVDNGSTDGGPDWVRQNRPDVRLVVLEENRGPCAARNRALEESRTRRVYLLDCDVVPGPESLVRLQADLDAHPDAVLAQPRALFHHEPHRVHYDGGWFSYTGLLTLRNFGALATEAGQASMDLDAVISMALLVDRDRLEKVAGLGNPFDEIYFIYFEDTDLSYRLRMAGAGLRLVPGAEVLHREGTAGVSYRPGKRLTHRRAFLLSRNRWILLLKTFSWRTLVLTFWAQMLYEGILFLFLACKGQPHGYLLGKADLMARLPRILEQRRAVQALRKVRDRDLLRFEGFSFIPLLRGGRVKRAAHGLLDRVFGLYWKCVRWLV